MREVDRIGINDAHCLHVTTGNPNEAGDSVYECSLPDKFGFRTFIRNGSSFEGAIRGIVGTKADADKAATANPGGIFFATALRNGEWAIPKSEIALNERMAIELFGHNHQTWTTRPIKKIEIL